jgi:hypothetical protein
MCNDDEQDDAEDEAEDDTEDKVDGRIDKGTVLAYLLDSCHTY